jgi:hypothetical protein
MRSAGQTAYRKQRKEGKGKRKKDVTRFVTRNALKLLKREARETSKLLLRL